MIKVLFICHGNICRSVSAEYIFKSLTQDKTDEFLVDSAATSDDEIGSPIYTPMRKALEKHNIAIGDHRARQVVKSDYEKYDYIIAMDEKNRYFLDKIFGEDKDNKIHYLLEYTDTLDKKVEDPWFTRDFEKAYQDINRGCIGLLDKLGRQ